MHTIAAAVDRSQKVKLLKYIHIKLLKYIHIIEKGLWSNEIWDNST
jgi:hypothetical protein